jgi:RecA-family ATPase
MENSTPMFLDYDNAVTLLKEKKPQFEFDKFNIGIEEIKTEAENLESIQGIFLVRTANQCINSAKSKPIPKCMFSEFWNEGELSILFAGAGIGKTILAVCIGESIAKGSNIKGFKNESEKQKVLYFDFELSDKQFEKRYSNNYTNHYLFDDEFLRIEINPDAEDFCEEILYQNIENTIIQTGAKILIIDNITYLRNNLENSKDALPLMKRLKLLKKKFKLSILCLAHTPKRDMSRPVNINDLSGSMMLGNFADSIFTINNSQKDKSVRYIKQIKARNTEHIFDTDNVVEIEIVNHNNFTGIEFIGFSKESEHLNQIKETDKSELEIAIVELKKASPLKSVRQIATELNCNSMKVQRTLKKHNQSVTL